MKYEPIIISLLDTDLYKFNMDQVIFQTAKSLTTCAPSVLSRTIMSSFCACGDLSVIM